MNEPSLHEAFEAAFRVIQAAYEPGRRPKGSFHGDIADNQLVYETAHKLGLTVLNYEP